MKRVLRTLKKVTFKADEETLEAIKKLTAAAPRYGMISPRSAAIRRALVEAAARVKE